MKDTRGPASLPALRRRRGIPNRQATASEARQAMKEYKYAPRPELVGSAETAPGLRAPPPIRTTRLTSLRSLGIGVRVQGWHRPGRLAGRALVVLQAEGRDDPGLVR